MTPGSIPTAMFGVQDLNPAEPSRSNEVSKQSSIYAVTRQHRGKRQSQPATDLLLILDPLLHSQRFAVPSLFVGGHAVKSLGGVLFGSGKLVVKCVGVAHGVSELLMLFVLSPLMKNALCGGIAVFQATQAGRLFGGRPELLQWCGLWRLCWVQLLLLFVFCYCTKGHVGVGKRGNFDELL